MIITIAIIVITCLVSISAFGNQGIREKLLFSPFQVKRQKEWTRFVTSGFIHAGYLHLGINMWVLFMFGEVVEKSFNMYFGVAGKGLYLVMYILGIIVSEIPSFLKHQDNGYYRSLGASGAVSAVLFAAILINPTQTLWLYAIIPLNAVLFGILYVGYSYYMDKKQMDNIGHSAHLFGAIFGFIFPIILKPSLIISFFEQIQSALPI